MVTGILGGGVVPNNSGEWEQAFIGSVDSCSTCSWSKNDFLPRKMSFFPSSKRFGFLHPKSPQIHPTLKRKKWWKLINVIFTSIESSHKIVATTCNDSTFRLVPTFTPLQPLYPAFGRYTNHHGRYFRSNLTFQEENIDPKDPAQKYTLNKKVLEH